MFYNCFSLSSIDISKWDFSRIKNLRKIFSNCFSLSYLPDVPFIIPKNFYDNCLNLIGNDDVN